MTRGNDHQSMNRPLDERTSDALLGGRSVPGEEALSAFVTDALALTELPAPTAALAELLDNGFVPDATLRPALPALRRHRWLLPIPLAVGSLIVAGGVFGAAGANALPAPAQRIVSDTVRELTPIHLPRPAGKPKPTIAPVPSEDPGREAVEPSESPEPSETAEPRESAESTEPSERPEPRDDTGTGRDDGESRAPNPVSSPPTDDRNDDSGSHDSQDGTTGDEPHHRG